MNAADALHAALLAVALPAAAAAQDLILIPHLTIEDLSELKIPTAYGSLYDVQAVRWSEPQGITHYPGSLSVVRARSDGSVMLGEDTGSGAIHALRWTALTDWVSLPQPSGTYGSHLDPRDMSDGGDVVVGIATAGSTPNGPYVGWRWTAAGGSTALADPDTERSHAECVSADGSWVGGSRQRTADVTSLAVRWDAAGVPSLIIPPEVPASTTLPSTLEVLNVDGSLGAGWFGMDAFLWEEGVGIAMLPRPEGSDGHRQVPTAMTDDGDLVVGSIETDYEEHASWMWMPGLGTRWIGDVAAQLRVPDGGSPMPFLVASDCSANGLRIAGTQRPATVFGDEGWILELPSGGVGAVVDLHKELSGDTTPRLDAFGSFGAGTDVTLELSHLLGLGNTTHLVIGASKLAAKFKGGVMVPNPDLVVTFAAPATKFDIPLAWPSGVPSLMSLYFQVWQPQLGGPLGWASSNALQVITP